MLPDEVKKQLSNLLWQKQQALFDALPGNTPKSKGRDILMKIEQSLLDHLALQMRCEYLSDLRLLSLEQRHFLAQKLAHMMPHEEDIWEWNDALTYLTNAPPAATARAAQTQLIQLLSSSKAGSD